LKYLKSGLGEGTGASHRALFLITRKATAKNKMPNLAFIQQPEKPMLVRVEAVKALIPNYEVRSWMA